MLTLCPTPIGNLGDVTPRQRDALSGADIIACEDTRTTGKLLELLGIPREDGRPRLWRFDEHRGASQVENLVEEIAAGRQVVLVSDAGTPTISDPGYLLVRACREAGLAVEALPGPVAAVVALSASGLPTDRFLFEGFLPRGTGERQGRLEALERLGATVVVYESPHRVEGTLEDIAEVYGADHEVAMCRELTKVHEEVLHGGVGAVLEELRGRDGGVKGEVVVVIGPGAGPGEGEAWEEVDRLIEALVAQELSARTIKEVVAAVHEVPRSALYDRIKAAQN